jgi:hypothetical protein
MDQKVIDFGTGYSKRPVRRRSVFENNEWSVPLYRVKSTGNNESLGSFHIDLNERNSDIGGKQGVESFSADFGRLTGLCMAEKVAPVQTAPCWGLSENIERSLSGFVAEREVKHLGGRESVTKLRGKLRYGLESKVMAIRRIF